jgi:hypothetical protein
MCQKCIQIGAENVLRKEAESIQETVKYAEEICFIRFEGMFEGS